MGVFLPAGRHGWIPAVPATHHRKGRAIMSEKESVLFLCSANSCRSQMAEGFLRKIAGARFEVYSAGLEPARVVEPLTVQVMEEVGISLAGQHPKSLKEFLGRAHITWLIIVCDQAMRNCPHVWPMMNDKNRLSWPFPDPQEARGDEAMRVRAFREVRDSIRAKLELWLATL